ncbi:hypothetical protein D3C87_325190 [compost metagenome]
MTHVKLISSLLGIFLFISGLCGMFGLLVSKILGFTLMVGLVLLVYFFIHGMVFGGLTD